METLNRNQFGDPRTYEVDLSYQPEFTNALVTIENSRRARLSLVRSAFSDTVEIDPSLLDVDGREADDALAGPNRASLAVIDGLGRAASGFGDAVGDVANRFFHDGEALPMPENPLALSRTVPQNMGGLALQAA
jgi:hypothetical protein